MKIVVVVSSLIKGGVERVVSLLHPELGKHHDLTLVIYHEPIEYHVEDQIINLDLPTEGGVLSKIVNLFKRTAALRRVFAELQPDLIISHAGAFHPILTGWPIVHAVHISALLNDEFVNNRLQQLLYRTVYRLPNIKAIPCVSQGIVDNLKENYSLHKATRVYNPLDLEAIEESMSGDSLFDFDFILAVGGFKEAKRFDLLVEAFAASQAKDCLLYTSPSPRDRQKSRMPSSA